MSARDEFAPWGAVTRTTYEAMCDRIDTLTGLDASVCYDKYQSTLAEVARIAFVSADWQRQCAELRVERDTLTAQVERLRTPPDALQTLLDLVTDTIPPDDLIISNGGDSIVPPWYAFAYFYAPSSAPPEEGTWEIDVKGDTLREVLCAVIAHPRFGQ